MKYIIEFEDEPYMREDGVNYYTCKSARWYKLGETIINRLTPYTEPDRETIENKVWELADYMCRMGVQERDLCFGFQLTTEVTANLSYQEAKAKFEEWMENESEIRVGDEVEYEDCKFVVTAEIGNKYHGIHSSNGDIVRFGEGDYCGKDKCKKTGRHFPEVAELLEKMRGEEE